MITFILICLLLIFSYTDLRENLLPNIIMFPAIIYGCIMTGNWVLSLTLFVSLAAIIEHGKLLKWCGGDVKLFAMIAAWGGWIAIPAVVVTDFLIRVYRYFTNYRLGLPLAPFACVTTIILLTAVAILRNVR